MILVDTNVLSEARRANGSPKVKAAVASYGDDVFLSVVVMGEIVFGIGVMAPGAARRALEDFHAELKIVYADRILPVTEDIAELWGELRACLRKEGRPLALADGLIAATALRHDLTIMTRNVRDFAPTGARLLNPWED